MLTTNRLAVLEDVGASPSECTKYEASAESLMYLDNFGYVCKYTYIYIYVCVYMDI